MTEEQRDGLLMQLVWKREEDKNNELDNKIIKISNSIK